MADSLLDARHATQLLLTPSEPAPESHLPACRNPGFTGARFFAEHPEQYRAIAALRAEGLPAAEVARQCGVSRNTVAAIDRREAGAVTVEQDRKEALMRYRTLERLTSERLEELLLSDDLKLSPQQAAILIGVLRDKIQLVSGQATSRAEIVERPTAEGLAALLEAARRAARVGMDLAGQTDEQKGPGAGGRVIEGEIVEGPQAQPEGGDGAPRADRLETPT
jgi:transcriptional regulator with XRE-family HTH domain